jgi:hypothetical protein
MASPWASGELVEIEYSLARGGKGGRPREPAQSRVLEQSLLQASPRLVAQLYSFRLLYLTADYERLKVARDRSDSSTFGRLVFAFEAFASCHVSRARQALEGEC